MGPYTLSPREQELYEALLGEPEPILEEGELFSLSQARYVACFQ